MEADIGVELGVQDNYLESSACEGKEEEAGLVDGEEVQQSLAPLGCEL